MNDEKVITNLANIDFIVDEMADLLEREKIWLRLSASESRNVNEIGKRIKRIKNITQEYRNANSNRWFKSTI